MVNQQAATVADVRLEKRMVTMRDGLLTTSGCFTKRLSSTSARSGALLFDPESLYRGALYAAALATLALTNGSRLAELLQVSADRFRVRPYQMRKDGNSTQVERI